MTTAGFVTWLAQESDKLAQATAGGGDPFPYLWCTAIDALDWLRQAPLNEREQALQAVRLCLDSGSFGETVIPTDAHAATCFRTLLGWVLHPPLVL